MSDREMSRALDEFQMVAYDRMLEAMTNFDLLDIEKIEKCFCDGFLDVLSAFSRGFAFLDTETVQVFNVMISVPWNNHEFDYLISQGKFIDVYNDMRYRLAQVKATMRTSLQKRFPLAYGEEIV